ncbi:MAG TPA: hypothetical protein VN875_17630 [Candidatus Binatus sp.]|nr:hypothetical protein [Candidatus Binatus sp.]
MKKITPFHSASSDLERTRILCRETLSGTGPEVLESYSVIRRGERVLVPWEKLTREERRVIAITLREMGREAHAEADRHDAAS